MTPESCTEFKFQCPYIMFYWNTAIPVGLCLVQSCIHSQSGVEYLDRDHEDDKA